MCGKDKVREGSNTLYNKHTRDSHVIKKERKDIEKRQKGREKQST